MFLRQSTAYIFRAGPFVDSTDGVTAEVALTIAQGDIQISKDGGAFAQTSATSPTTTHDSDGYYQCPLTATDTGTLGPLTVQITMAGALPVWRHWQVVDSVVYDSLFDGADTLPVDVIQIGGGAQSATDLKDFADDGYDPSTNKVQGVVLTDTCTTNTDMRGTDSAALASVCTEARLAELGASNLPADLDAVLADTGEMQTKMIAVIAGAFTGTPTTTTGNTDLSGLAADVLIGRYIYVTSGTYQGAFGEITDYTVSGGVLVYSTLTGAPSAADTFIVA